jgi:succinyl-CoA synthetase alpha subunit
MGIWLSKDSRVMVQGITGKNGRFHTAQMLAYGTKVVAGVTPGREGEEVLGVPVFTSVERAVATGPIDVSIIFVPAPAAGEAILEAAASGVGLVICITEGIPILSMARIFSLLHGSGVRLLGPNCPGVITPGESKVGIMPGSIHTPGPVGVISRSGTLTYEAVSQLTALGIGQSTCLGIGGDPFVGTSFTEALEAFREDPKTEAVLIIGEIGGSQEGDAARYLRETAYPKPVFAYIAGKGVPPERRMGHAGAIIHGTEEGAVAKEKALADAGVTVIDSPSHIGRRVAEGLR